MSDLRHLSSESLAEMMREAILYPKRSEVERACRVEFRRRDEAVKLKDKVIEAAKKIIEVSDRARQCGGKDDLQRLCKIIEEEVAVDEQLRTALASLTGDV